MDVADFDVGDFQDRYAADKGVHARFYTFPEQDKKASAEAGRPIFKDVEYVEIMAAGNSSNVIRRPARDSDRHRFPRHYAAFQQGKGEEIIGTPLSEVPWITRSQVEEFAHLRIYSIEALANLDDSTCGKFAGLYDMKRKAAAYLKAAEDAAPTTALMEENEALRSRLEASEQQVKELAEAVKKLTPKK